MSAHHLLPTIALAVVTGLSALVSCNPAADVPDALPSPDASDETQPDLAQPADMTAATGDSLPKHAVAFFQRKTCPTGWQPLAKAAGRTLVPTVDKDPSDVSVGDPLADGEDRAHVHSIKTTFDLSTVSYAGIAGEANHGLARGGSQAITGTTSAAPSGLPYVQLLVCSKQDEPSPQLRPIAAGTLVFFQASDCPQGFVQAGASQGRLIIGTPELATPGQKFGGGPLRSGEKRGHRHITIGNITTKSQGIALASGGGASGYAKDAKHPYRIETVDDTSGFPYLQLLHCQKQ